MSLIVAIIFAAIVLSGLLDIYSERRQAACVVAHRDRVPTEFIDQLSPRNMPRPPTTPWPARVFQSGRRLSIRSAAVLWLGLLLAPLYALVATIVLAGLDAQRRFW